MCQDITYRMDGSDLPVPDEGGLQTKYVIDNTVSVSVKRVDFALYFQENYLNITPDI